MLAPCVDRFVTPEVVKLAKVRQDTFKARINRKISRHSDAVENHPHGLRHQYLQVPSGSYFLFVPVGASRVELCSSSRIGTPIGAPFRVSLTRYYNLLSARNISPVLVSSTPLVYHVPPAQWKAMREVLVRQPTTSDTDPHRRPVDPLRQLHNTRFGSLKDFGSAVARRTLGLPVR